MPSPARVLSVGVIGAGEIAAKVHLPTLRAIEGIRVGWITDRNPDRAREVARAYGVPWCRLPTHPTELPSADVVLLAIPYGARGPYYETLAVRRSAVYVEKPFARTLEEHDRRCHLFSASRLACGLQRRLWGPLQLARSLVEEQVFGRLRRAHFGLGSPGVRTGGGYSATLQLAGGGRLFELGVHGIDGVLFVAGATDIEVGKVAMTIEEGFDLDTAASLIVTDASGAKIEFGLIVSWLREAWEGWEFVFDRAAVRIAFSYESDVQVVGSGRRAYLVAPFRTPYPQTAHQVFHAYWTAFLDGVRTDHVNVTSAVNARLTTAAIEQLYRLGSGS